MRAKDLAWRWRKDARPGIRGLVCSRKFPKEFPLSLEHQRCTWRLRFHCPVDSKYLCGSDPATRRWLRLEASRRRRLALKTVVQTAPANPVRCWRRSKRYRKVPKREFECRDAPFFLSPINLWITWPTAKAIYTIMALRPNRALGAAGFLDGNRPSTNGSSSIKAVGGDYEFEDLGSCGSCGNTPGGFGHTSARFDFLGKATGGAAKTCSGAATGYARSAHGTATAAAGGPGSGSAANGHRGGIERGEYRCGGDGPGRRHTHEPSEGEFSGSR